MTDLDRRLHAFRPDLADERLVGKVNSARFVQGRPMRVGAPVVDLRSAPRPDAGVDTQLLAGDEVVVFEEREGWAWLQSVRDLYVGYAAAAGLDYAVQPTHIVAVPRTFGYREPDLRKGVVNHWSLGCAVTVVGGAETRGTAYALLAGGEAVIASHLLPLGTRAADFVAVAELLENTPYLWGGASAFGIDCSGLVQLSMRMAGEAVLRDTDMQATSIGTPLAVGADLAGLERGDLVFWKGHVAIVTDPDTIIHANGHTMMVSRELLREAVDRIAYLYELPTGFRRP